MRLDNKTIKTIKELGLRYFGNNAKIYIFGSRTDDSKKGGDIDIYVETDLNVNSSELFDIESKYWVSIQKELGEMKIDIVINDINFNKKSYIYEVAKKTGIALN